MTLVEFIENLKILSDKYPNAVVNYPEAYSINSKSTLYSDSAPRLVFDYTKQASDRRYETRQAELQNHCGGGR